MSTEHTPGRIKSSHVFFDGGAPLFLSSGESKIIARIENRVSGLPLTREDAENARRLAACWNALEGIRTESLENNLPIKEMAERYNAALSEHDELQQTLLRIEQKVDELVLQRDELLTALKRIEGATMSMYTTQSAMLDDLKEIAFAAIYKMEGGNS